MSIMIILGGASLLETIFDGIVALARKHYARTHTKRRRRKINSKWRDFY